MSFILKALVCICFIISVAWGLQAQANGLSEECRRLGWEVRSLFDERRFSREQFVTVHRMLEEKFKELGLDINRLYFPDPRGGSLPVDADLSDLVRGDDVSEDFDRPILNVEVIINNNSGGVVGALAWLHDQKKSSINIQAVAINRIILGDEPANLAVFHLVRHLQKQLLPFTNINHPYQKISVKLTDDNIVWLQEFLNLGFQPEANDATVYAFRDFKTLSVPLMRSKPKQVGGQAYAVKVEYLRQNFQPSHFAAEMDYTSNPWDFNVFEQLLENRKIEYLTARTVDGRIAGYLLYAFDMDAAALEVLRYAVADPFNAKDVLQSMFEVVLEEAVAEADDGLNVEQIVKVISVPVWYRNFPALEVLSKLGFDLRQEMVLGDQAFNLAMKEL